MGMDQQASVMLVLPLLLIKAGLIALGLPSTGSARPSCPQHAGCCCPSHPAGNKSELTKYLPAGFFCFLLSGLLEKKPIITHIWAFSSSIWLFLPAVLHKGVHAQPAQGCSHLHVSVAVKVCPGKKKKSFATDSAVQLLPLRCHFPFNRDQFSKAIFFS